MTGDGRADVFRSSGGTWYLSRSGTDGWSRLNQSNAPVHQLAVTDFTGDGRADVIANAD